jgi:NADH dehydrogenase [ubiquinone] 1 alpha subcomplex assembly factor 1
MRTNRETALALFSLAIGALLMTLPGPRLNASDAAPAASKSALMLTDFAADSPELGWYVQNDNVMGGRSEGGFETTSGELIFAGSTNTNGGGFSSIRTRPFEELDVSKYDGIQLRVKGDGRRYTWQLQTNARYRGFAVSYWAEFDTPDGEWSTINIPFAKFYPQFRGFKLDGPELNRSEITEFGLYIYDKKDGAFKLLLDSVEAYTGETL